MLFIKNMDKLFDCFNVSSRNQDSKKRKSIQGPYKEVTDNSWDKFNVNVQQFLNEVLKYLTKSGMDLVTMGWR